MNNINNISKNNMLPSEINNEKLNTNENADPTSRTTFENSKNMGKIALGVAIVAPIEIVKMGAGLVLDKINKLRGKSLPENGQDLSSEEIKDNASHKFDNFKTMGQIALGVAVLLPVELGKMAAVYVSGKINQIRGEYFSPSTSTDDNRKNKI